MVDRIPCHMEDLRPLYRSTTSEEDHDVSSSMESGSESLLHNDVESGSSLEEEVREKETEEAEELDPCLYGEVLGKSDLCWVATYVIVRSRISVAMCCQDGQKEYVWFAFAAKRMQIACLL